MLALLAALLLAAAPSGGPLPARLGLQDALALLRARGLDRLLAELPVEAARADLLAADASPNPLLSAGAGKVFSYDASCAGCSSVPLQAGLSDQAALWDLVTGKRGLRAAVARAALEAATRSRDAALRALETQLKVTYLQALAAERQVALAGEAGALAERTRALDQRRFEAGAINEAELARVEVQALQAEQLRDQATAQRAAARAALGLLLGAPLEGVALDDRALDFALPPALAAANEEGLLARAQEERPEPRAAQAQEARAEAALALARRQRLPDVALSAAWQQTGTGAAALQPPTLTFGLSVPLPLFYQQQGEVARAEAEVGGQRLALARARAQVAAEVRSAWAAFLAARARVERGDARLRPRALRARELIEVQWSKGAASPLDLLDAQRTWLSIESDHLQDLAAYWTSVASLEQAVGKEL